MSTAERWLRERFPTAPQPLLAAMIAALPPDAQGVPDALAAGALHLYRTVGAGQGGRDDALPLLAADALLTHALQAQAEHDPAGIAALAARWGATGGVGSLAEGTAP